MSLLLCKYSFWGKYIVSDISDFFKFLMKIKVGELRSLLHHGPDHVQLTFGEKFREIKFHEKFRENEVECNLSKFLTSLFSAA